MITFPKEYISNSQIESYERCPHYYNLHYVQGIEEDTNFYAEFGKALHEACEYDGNFQITNHQHAPYCEMVDVYEEYWETHDMKFPSMITEEQYHSEGLRMIKDYLGRPVQNIIGIEKEFMLILPSLPVPIKGIIDKLYLDSNNEIVVTDYKSGREYDKTKVATGIQLSIYGMAVRQELGKYPISYEYDFLKPNKVVKTNRSKAAIVKALMFIRRVVNSIMQEDFNHRYKNHFWCNNLCAFGKQGVCQGG